MFDKELGMSRSGEVKGVKRDMNKGKRIPEDGPSSGGKGGWSEKEV